MISDRAIIMEKAAEKAKYQAGISLALANKSKDIIPALSDLIRDYPINQMHIILEEEKKNYNKKISNQLSLV